MLDWFRKRCPVDAREKAWIETRMLQLSDHWGSDRLTNAVVPSPDDRFLPDPWTGSRDDVQQLADRLATQLQIRSPEIAWDVSNKQAEPTTAPQPPSGSVSVSPDQRNNVWQLTRFLLHGMARDALNDHPSLRPDHPDFARTSDLLSVYCGLGVLLAHAYQAERCGNAGDCCSRSPAPRAGLPDRMLGYALALFAWLRHEKDPRWAGTLGPDVALSFAAGLRYLRRTADSTMDYDRFLQPGSPFTSEQLIGQLKGGSRSARIVALWELREPDHTEQAVPEITRCLHDRSPLIREEAAKTLACYGPAAQGSLHDLVDLLHDRIAPVRAAAALALGAIKHEPEQVVSELALLLEDADLTVVQAAAIAVKQFETEAGSAAPALVRALRQALVRCDYGLIDTLAHALVSVDSDPLGHLSEYLEDDPELSHQALQLLAGRFEQAKQA